MLMKLSNRLSRIFGSEASAAQRGPARRRSARLGLEQLDQRVLPSITPLGSPVAVSGQTFGHQFASSDRTVARAANGNYAVTWSASNSDGSSGIFVRLFQGNGTALTAPIHVNTTNAADIQPSIAMNANGQFAVAWTHFGPSNQDVRGQRFNASGGRVGSELAVAATPRNEGSPSVALDNAGNLMVAYTTEFASGDHDLAIFRRSAAGAVSVIGVAGTPADETAPSLALNANGQGVLAWVSSVDFSGKRVVNIQRLTSAGTFVGPSIDPNNFS